MSRNTIREVLALYSLGIGTGFTWSFHKGWLPIDEVTLNLGTVLMLLGLIPYAILALSNRKEA